MGGISYIKKLDEPELVEAIERVESLNPIVSEDFSIEWEFGGMQNANEVDNAVENLTLKYGTRKFKLTYQEESFIETCRLALSNYECKVKTDFKRIFEQLDKSLKIPIEQENLSKKNITKQRAIPAIEAQIFREIDYINRWTNDLFGQKLFLIHEHRIMHDLNLKCQNEDDFNKLVLCLNNLVDWMNSEIFKREKIDPDGSINKLEKLIERRNKNYNKETFTNFRLIKKLRRKFPIHSDSKEFIKALENLGENYPVNNWEVLCSKTKEKFFNALISLRKSIIEIKDIS